MPWTLTIVMVLILPSLCYAGLACAKSLKRPETEDHRHCREITPEKFPILQSALLLMMSNSRLDLGLFVDGCFLKNNKWKK